MANAIEPGTTVSHYRVLEKLGAGGMGEVYVAEDTQLGRRVALKVLPESAAHDQARLHRFEQEARAVSHLNHPNILTVHDVLDREGRPVMVTELVQGVSLRARGFVDLRSRSPRSSTSRSRSRKPSLPPTPPQSSTVTSSPRT